MTEIILYSLGGFLLLSVIAMLFITMRIARQQFRNLFMRTSPEKWGRENSCPENPEHSRMFQLGLDWGKANEDRKIEVCTENDGLKLYGEYYDFGSDKCAIILPGRAESLLYAYYFAQPYQELGYNVLVIDVRAHGYSEGIYSGVGVKEQGDDAAWIRLLHEQFGISHVVLHGICLGSASSVFLAAKGQPYLDAIVLEGPFTSFYEVLKQRTRTGHHPVFPVVQEIAFLLLFHAKVNIFREKPIRYMDKVRIPVLFLCGKMDISSLPENCEKLFHACGSARKKIVWFERGAHSHLRIADTAKYDESIREFIAENSL